MRAHAIDLQGANLISANLEGVDFRYSCFRGLDPGVTKGACFSNSNLKNANFQEADLVGVDFEIANLQGADFTEAKLVGTIFRDADLTGARLSGAKMAAVDFRGATLKDVDLSGIYSSQITNANIDGAYLRTHSGRIFVSGVKLVTYFRGSSIGLFTTKNNQEYPYLIEYDNWVGDFDDFKGLHKPDSDPDQKEFLTVEAAIKEALSSLPLSDSSLKPDISDRRADYLLAEARRTGRSPADIVLGDD